MRKSHLALPLLLLAVSCIGRFSCETSSEVTLDAVFAGLNGKDIQSNSTEDSFQLRDIHISAYNTTRRQPFFVDAQFRKNGSYWNNYVGGIHSPLYWPKEYRLDVMAYSTLTSTPSAFWNPANPASSILLDVSETSLDDAILYASAKSCSYAVAREYGEGHSNIRLQFHHAQARINFEISSNDLNVAFLKGIILEGVHTSGLMKVDDSVGIPELSWDFSSSPLVQHTIFPEIANSPIPGTSSTPLKYTILLPPQPRSSFKVLFMAWKGNQTVEKTVTCTLDRGETWFAGIQYTYRINVTSGDFVLTSTSTKSSDSGLTVIEEEWN